MPPKLTAKEVRRAIERDGWYFRHQKGSHAYFRHDSKPGYVTIAMHTGRIIAPGTMQSILRQSGLTAEDMLSLL
jgi:predicted RNA binding protein YcfA (HicA-like mRNA interferase family)